METKENSRAVINPTTDITALSPSVEPQVSAPVAKGEIPVINYLRGIAAMGVVLFHVRVPLWVGWREIQSHPDAIGAFDRLAALLSLPSRFLGSCIWLFFIISGFCVHLPQTRDGKPVQLTSYLCRRFFRIYPPYLAAVLLSALAAYLLPQNVVGSNPTSTQVVTSVLMVQNYNTLLPGAAASGAGQLPTNSALWSLPVELEFYLLYPFFLVVARRLGWGMVLALVGGVSVIAGIAFTKGHFWLTGNFAIYWLLWWSGAWLAEKYRSRDFGPPPVALGFVSCGALVAALAAHSGMLNEWAIMPLYGLFFFWGVWFLLAKPRLWMALPGWIARPLAASGNIAYSIYLLHFPLFFALGAWWYSSFGGKPVNFLVPLAACFLILPVAWLFFRVVELPSHRLAKYLGMRFQKAG